MDDRERQAGLLEAFSEMPGVCVRIERLRLADYVVDERCLFERKRLDDFARSIVDGRLFAQARRLAGAGQPAALILEGSGSFCAECLVRREALQGALISLQLIFGLPVLWSQDAPESARLMIYAADQLLQAEGGGSPRRGYRPRTRQRLQLHILQGLPRVGPTRARALLEACGDVQHVMAASADRLAQVPGIGPDTARRVRWAVSRDGEPDSADLEDFAI